MEAQTFAKNFFSMATNSSENPPEHSDHNEWLLREYAKLMKKELELKKREEAIEKQSIVNQNSQ